MNEERVALRLPQAEHNRGHSFQTVCCKHLCIRIIRLNLTYAMMNIMWGILPMSVITGKIYFDMC